MNRRGFLSLLVAAPVTRSLPWKAIAKAIEPIAPATAAAIGLTLSEIIAATIKKRRPELIANIAANNALLAHLKATGTVKPFTGGLTIKANGTADEKIKRFKWEVRL
jgi:hypothetical protein